MKFLILALVFLSVNAKAALHCVSDKSTRTVVTTLDQAGKDFVVTETISRMPDYEVHTTTLYVEESAKNMIFETVHKGTAEVQTQVDVFAKFKFVAIVPDVIENGVTVRYLKDDGETITKELRFTNCQL